jgi:hypothetical protein
MLAFALVSLAALCGGCGIAEDPRSEIATGADGLRTFTHIHARGGTAVACGAFALADPVHGTLQGAAEAREPVWIETEDGRRLSGIWPPGFSVRFEPRAVLYNELGKPVAWADEPTELSQTRWDEATGTYEDPYVAHEGAYGGCYPYFK